MTRLMGGGEFEHTLDAALQASPFTPLAILVLGADRFRHLNELLGHAAGDAALEEIGYRLAVWAPPGAATARLGGDEFAAFLPGASPESALLHADAVLASVKSPLRLKGREVYLSFSAGIALYPDDGPAAAALIAMASQAMARAKQRGGNSVERAAGHPGLRPEERYSLESAMRRAMERGELSLRYQAQVDREGQLRGLEALLVWDHAEMGRVETETFIHLAEETGAINEIGAWVLKTACRQIAAWKKAGLRPPRVAVNVSALQFSSPDFVKLVELILHEAGLDGDALELEVTESAVLQDLEESASRMAQLRELGVRIAIDDFGVGYSPLTYLHRLPLDVVKVDRTFVERITEPSGSLPLVHTITVLAHHRGLKVVAEGVETQGELELVCAARCDLVQGFLFGEPMAPAQVAALMSDPGPLAAPFTGRTAARF